MKKEWFFDRFCGEQLAVYTEDGKIVELSGQKDGAVHAIGDIYKGKVENVVAGMQAAFVSLGMEKNCYLPLGEGTAPFSSYDGEGKVREKRLKAGDELLVQLVKPARGGKGAKVTCELSFVGKNLIFLPQTDFLGISRKITDQKKREELLATAGKLREKGEGFIVRTAADGVQKGRLKVEAEYLRRIYRAAVEQAKSAPVGAAVYREYELAVKVMRDSLEGGVHKIYVGDRELYETVLRLVRLRSDLTEKQVVLYEGTRTMFSHFGLTEQIYALADPRAELNNGGYLIIDRTEAMTVIDVNTGKYTGESDLESTVFETNLLAAEEIARQVRLRNLGGIVAVDFIDMGEEKHRTAVDEALRAALNRDRSRCRVLPMSELCVSLFTRKRTSSETASFLFRPCPHCTRQGSVFSEAFMAMRIRAAVSDCFADGYASVLVDLNEALMHTVLDEHYLSKEASGAWRGKRVYLLPHADFHEERLLVRGDNAPVLSLPGGARLLY